MSARRIILTPEQATDLRDAVESLVQSGIEPARPDTARQPQPTASADGRWEFSENPTPLTFPPLQAGELVDLRGQNPFIGVAFFVRARILEIEGDQITAECLAVWDERNQALNGTPTTNLGFGEPAPNEIIRFSLRHIQARQAENSPELGIS